MQRRSSFNELKAARTSGLEGIRREGRVAALAMVSATIFLAVAVPVRGGDQGLGPVDVATYAPPGLFNSKLALIPTPLTRPSSKWDAFEAKFVELQPSSSPLLDPLIETKHAADVSLFTAAELANRLSNFLELRYSNGRIGRSFGVVTPHPSTRWHSFPVRLEDTRLKFDFVLATSKPYMGARLVIPFGN